MIEALAVTGMGSFDLATSFELDVPATTFAAVYESTVTVTIESGPGL